MTKLYFTSENGFVAVHLASDESVNAWDGAVTIRGADHALVTTARGISAVWQMTPQFQNGIIAFSGGVPGGVKGDVILFRFAPSAPASVAFTAGTRVYLNDGKGTEITPKLAAWSAEGVPQTALAFDTTPPEPFAPTLYTAKEIFDGKPVVIFGTEDRDSGVARYEVKEVTTRGEGDWHTAQSPYLVNPDVRMIEIRAIDYAGNIREESIRVNPFSWKAGGALFAALLLAAIGYTIYTRWKRNR